MRKLLALLSALTSPALAQTPAGVINAPIYATGYISQVGGTNVTTNIPPQPNHPTNLNIYTTGSISGTWTIKLPNPAFEGQMLSFNCGAAANAISIISSDGSSIDPNLPTSCTANGGFVAQFDLRSNIWRSLGSGYSANFRPFTGVTSQWPWQLNTDGTWTLKQPDAVDVTFTQAATGAITTTVQNELAARISVTQFGVKCDGATDDTTALAKVKTYLDGLEAGSKKLPAVHFPAGTCLFTLFPNLAFNNLILQADGEVRLRLTSSSAISTVSIDGSVKGGVTNMQMLGRWIIEGPSTSAYGLAITQVHHSKFEATCRGAGTASSCFYNAFTVANNYHYTCSNNEPGGFYSKPFYCLLVTSYGGNKSGFDTYYTPIFEGVSVGISLLHSLGSTFIGGTSEGHSIGGVQFGTDSNLNKFIGTDFEENGTYDAYIEGDDNELNTVNTQTKVQVVGTATNTRIVGGHHWAIQVDTGALRTRITDALYNVANNGSTLSDLGTGTILLNTTNQGTGVTTNTPGKTDKANTWASAQTFSVAPVLSTITGLVKGNGASAVTAAVSGTDYAPATSGTSILKGNGSGGFSAAVSNTDYAPVASPAFSGAPTAPTQTALDNSTKLATTAYVDAAAPQAAWSSVTPTVTWTGGTPTGWSISARYRKMGKTVDYAWTLTEGTALNGATSVTIGTPSGLLLQSNTALMCQDIFDSTIYTSYGAAGAAATNFYSVAANHVLVCNGTFEVQ